MSTDTESASAIQQLKARVQTPVAARYARLALATYASAGALLYWLAFVRPYNLVALYDQPLLDLYRISQDNPAARWSLLWGFLGLGALYWLGWRAAQLARGRLAWAIVLGGAAVYSAILLFLYPFGAADVFDNILHGRILGVYGANPFHVVGNHFPDDPFRDYVAWPRSPSAYGPIWESLAALAARLAGDGIVANVLAFKLLGGAFLVASIAVVAAVLRRMAPERALAGVVLLAWNPVILYETLGNGHNDIAMIFWVLAAAWLLTQRRYTLAILSLVMGALFKFIPLLMLPAAGLIALRDLPDNRARVRFVVVTGLASLLLVGSAYAPFWQDLSVLTIDRRTQLFTTSIPSLVFYTWLEPGLGRTTGAQVASGLAAALTALFALWQGAQAWRNRAWISFAQAAFQILMFYLLLTCLWFQSWYALWPLGLAALLPPGHAARMAALFGYAVLAKPLIFDPMWLWIRPLPPKAWRELRLGPAVLALPWLYTALAVWDSRRRKVGKR